MVSALGGVAGTEGRGIAAVASHSTKTHRQNTITTAAGHTGVRVRHSTEVKVSAVAALATRVAACVVWSAEPSLATRKAGPSGRRSRLSAKRPERREVPEEVVVAEVVTPAGRSMRR